MDLDGGIKVRLCERSVWAKGSNRGVSGKRLEYGGDARNELDAAKRDEIVSA